MPDAGFRVLLVSARASDVGLVAAALRERGQSAVVAVATDAARALLDCRDATHDVVLLDLGAASGSCAGFLSGLRDTRSAAAPVVVLAEDEDEEALERALLDGAQDLVGRAGAGPRRLVQALRSAILRGEHRQRLRLGQQEALSAVRARGQVLSVVTHDLRNSLSVVDMNQRLVRSKIDDAGLGHAVAVPLTRIGRAVRQMSRMVDDLLDAARLQAGERLDLACVDTDLAGLVRGQVQDLRRQWTEDQLALSGDAEVVGWWDGARLERVVANLLSNALKYSLGTPQVTVEVRQEGAHAVLRVQDCGIGIPEADQARLFEWYQRASNVPPGVGGTGVGLAGVRAVVALHGGAVQIRSQEGQGTEVIVRLPLRPELAAEARAASPASAGAACLS